MFKILLLLCTILCHSSWAYHIQKSSITVSGLSSGAYMAGQLHIAYSHQISGVAIIAGGPYLCSQGNTTLALYSCMMTALGLPNLKMILNSIQQFEKMREIDSTDNLINDKVLLLSGTHDTVVNSDVVQMNQILYENLGLPPHMITSQLEIPFGHAFPTLTFGNSCSTPKAPPYISACNYDAAQVILETFYGTLNSPQKSVSQNFYTISQNNLSAYKPSEISMADDAILYIPKSCQNGNICRLHVALHGCEQTIDDIDDLFFTKAGYNEWAESNNIIILYPQVRKSLPLSNPHGCWDWFGYSSKKFATKDAPQMQVIMENIEALSEENFRARSQYYK